MKKYFPHISAFVLTVAIVFAISGFVLPQTVQAQDASATECGWTNLTQCFIDALLFFPGWMALLVLQLATHLTGLAGLILNYVVQFTVVDMSKHISGIEGVNLAWKAIRDIANMAFIFILLYAAIRTILGVGDDAKKLIVNIVVVAILINFSLFFTKVVIDTSNVLSIMLYDEIAPTALDSTVTYGLSGRLMQPLGLTSLWNNPEITAFKGERLLIIGVMGTIVSLIAAFVFFAVAIMLVIRFVVLIFVLILSPLAFMGFILPQLKKYRDQWWDALSGQAFFAPIYFMLTWIVIAVSSGILSAAGDDIAGGDLASAFIGAVGPDGKTVLKPPLSSIAILVNFILVIAFLIASLIIAKQWASKAGPGVAGMTKWAMGAAGGATLGMGGRFGRNTFGRMGAAIGDSERLKEREIKGGLGGMAARLALATGRRTGGASFDVRGTGLGGTLEAGKAQKGGFAQTLKDKRKKEKEFADSLAPSDTITTDAERAAERAKANYGVNSAEFTRARREVDRLKGVDEKEALKRLQDEDELTEQQAKAVLQRDRDAYISKGQGEIRKEAQVVNMENSLTYRAARAAQSIVNRVPEKFDRVNIPKGGTRVGVDVGRRNIGFTVPRQVPTGVGAMRAVPNLIRAKNRAAIAEIRKGKKPFKDRIEEILKDEGELSNTEGGGGTPTGTPPGGAASAGGPATP